VLDPDLEQSEKGRLTMASTKKSYTNTQEIDRLALQLVKDPQSKAFMPLAEEYVKAGMWQEAAGVLEDGLKHYPGFITAMVALGRAYDQMGQSTKARAILEEAIKLSPENLRAHRTLVKIYASQGLADAARRCCTVILAVNPQDEEALSIQAQIGAPIPQRPPAKVADAPRKAEKSALETSPASSATAPPTSERPSEPTDVDPLATASALMDTTLERIRRPSAEPAEEGGGPIRTTPASGTSASSQIVSQLETWLRSIQTRRRDRDQTDHAHSSSS
jgi:tetratricopeptide (TPR) repeat protein